MPLPAYYAILPAAVRYDRNLSASAKLIYAEITARMSQDGVCWDTNQVFMELHNASERAVRGWIAELVDADHLFVREFRRPEGTARALSASKSAIMACEAPQTPRQIPAGRGGLARAGDIKGNLIHERVSGLDPTPPPANQPEPSAGDLFAAPAADSPVARITATLHGQILASYRSICVPAGLADVRTLNDARKGAIKQRLAEAGGRTEVFTELFTKAASSQFLTGKNPGQTWRADFDFLISPSGFTKTLEGKYDNKAQKNKGHNGNSETPDL